ncbi:MAG TPA: nitroreductase [Chitinophagaceae bacterium]|jgi:nitroreductase|nr:nitroreductase [Chitinophagaceae bacterium]
MTDRFEIIADIIKNRRSIKPVKMNGKKIPDEQVRELLKLANWAPTHGRTEPWRFIVYSGDKVTEFCHEHAELYKAHTAVEKFEQVNYDKLLHNGDLVSHIIIAVMQRGDLPKIPALEEIAATAIAIQNILLGATAAGIASFWSTGGMTHHPLMKDFLQLKEHDIVMSLLYLGYTDEQMEGKRQTEIEEKVIWK